MSTDKLKLAVFISGGGTNLQALIDACKKPDFPAEISVVVSNIPNVYGLVRAQQAGIECSTVDHTSYATREAFEEAIENAMSWHDIDLICLAGFMRILTPSFIGRWKNKIINTHPALLPKFGGPGMYGENVHKAVLEAGETESGCTIHYVIPEVDKGEIIVQRRVPVMAGDTPSLLAGRVLLQEHIAYPEAVRKIALEKKGLS